MKMLALSQHVRCRIPTQWAQLGGDNRAMRFRTPDGGIFSAILKEFQKSALPSFGSGPTSEEMLSTQVAEFRVPVKVLALGRVYATHSVMIGEPGHEQECRAWHLVNQVGPWHHETVLFTYEPPSGCQMDASILTTLDVEVPLCEFRRTFDSPDD